MQHLRQLSASERAAWYALEEDANRAVTRYLVSTPEGREVCNRPELLGVHYTNRLQTAMASALAEAPFREWISAHREERTCVVHFLRGGLNFGLRDALHQAYDFNRHCSAFMSSQRFRADGRWGVKENMYRKLEIPQDAILLMGDVVATGVTMGRGLDVIFEHLRDIGSSVKGLVLFTVGCHKAEKLLEPLDERMRATFPGYEKTILVYVEAKFRLVDSKTPLKIGVPGTDLVRLDALMSPEFALSQYEAPQIPLERCAIYDAGSRAFDVPTYVEDVAEYWQQLRALGREGLSLEDALLERWPWVRAESRSAFVDRCAPVWPAVDANLVARNFEAQEKFWEALHLSGVDSKALVQLCESRLDALPNLRASDA